MEELAQGQYFDLILLGDELKHLRQDGKWSVELIDVMGHEYAPVRYFQCKNAGAAYIPNAAH